MDVLPVESLLRHHRSRSQKAKIAQTKIAAMPADTPCMRVEDVFN